MPVNGFTGIPLKSFGSLCTLLDPTNVPISLSPDCQDVVFAPGLVKTRPGLTSEFPVNINPTVNYDYIKTYITNALQARMLALDSFGVLWKEQPQGTLIDAASIETPGAYGNSTSIFGREYIAFGDGKFGSAIPRQYNDSTFDRVSQVGPGAGPTVADFLPAPATITNPASPTTVSISTEAVSDPSSFTYTIPPIPGYSGGGTFTITIYGSVTVTTAAPHGLTVGETFNVSGSSADFYNATGLIVLSVVSSTVFKYAISSFGAVAGTGGTLTIPAPSLIRTGNVVTVITDAPHGFQAALTVIIAGIPNNTIGTAITAISRTTGEMTVTTTDPNGLIPGSNVLIEGVTGDLTLNGTFVVGSVSSPITFVIDNAGDNSVGTVSGSSLVQDIFDGTYTISSIPSPTSFTYQDIGPDDESDSSGTATILGNVVAGTHQVAVSFVTENDYTTIPSPPVTFIAAGGKLVALSNIPVGPPNIAQRILMFTPFLAPGTTLGSFYHRPETMIINDNVTTNFVTDFSDSYLLAGESTDNLFELEEIGECSGVTEYNERLFWTGERNKIQNFLNLTFDGGWAFPAPPTFGPRLSGLGTDGGGSNPWTAPNNVTSTISYATSSLTVAFGGFYTLSNILLAENFLFTVPAGVVIAGVQVTINSFVSSSGSGFISSAQITAQLLKNGVPVGTPKTFTVGAVAADYILGSPTDTWGTTLIGSDINAVNYGVQFRAQVKGTTGKIATFSINNVRQSAASSDSSAVPLGWTLDSTSGLGGRKETALAIFGDAYKILGDGVSAIRGMIIQGAVQDSFGAPIMTSGTGYSVRLWLRKDATLSSGSIVFELFSPSQGTLGNVTVTNFQVSATKWTEIIGEFCASTVTIPQDAEIRFYASNTINLNAYYLADNIAVFPTLVPYITSTVRASEVEDPDSYMGENDQFGAGLIGVAQENGQSITSTFRIRDFLYIVKQQSLYVTSDDGQNEPDQWAVNEVSPKVGSLSVRGVGLGDEWAAIASQSGLWFFEGSQFSDDDNLSKEIQPTWDSINWQAGQTLDVKVDTAAKRIYVAAPFGSSTVPNKMLVLDYTEGFANSLIQQPLGTGPGRKWTIWNIPCNSMNFVLRDDGSQPLFIGNNTGTGKIYGLDNSVADDDGSAIDSYWQSGYFQGDTRLNFAYLTANVTGTGICLLTLRKGDQRWLKPIRGWNLNPNGFSNMERQIQVAGDRLAVKFETNSPGHNFSLQGAEMFAQESAWTPVRGINR